MLANITDEVSCRMNKTNQEVWDGFLKNIYNGLGRSFPLVVLLTVFYSFFYIGPLLLLAYGLIEFQPVCFIPYLLITCQRYIVDRVTNQGGYLSFLMPLLRLHSSASCMHPCGNHGPDNLMNGKDGTIHERINHRGRSRRSIVGHHPKHMQDSTSNSTKRIVISAGK